MTNLVYLRYEMLRTARNWKFLLFSLALPLILFLVVAGSQRHTKLDGIPFPLYYMTGMASWGAMMAVISLGGNIATERQIGWTRQIRITPLSAKTYMVVKILGAYALALVSIVLLFLAGGAIGVSLTAGQWLLMAALIVVGLIPFVVLGIALGHLLTPDSLGPAMGGVTAILALLGGAWGPIISGGLFLKMVKLVPSYWLVQAGKTAQGGSGWPLEAWIVVAVWAVVLARLAMRIYRRDTVRV